ncbi:MAG: response regulator transcription factor [Verrucomicrobia bacterium]|jgi:DNA-binding NarL/FixJ family response regulator|nr:response regulator transcription factor [Verrucomicrobiota bacterium]|tara:strand:+ start:296 stop:718 length:423 start_codon:yes stop_codon:yes gene_type:complete
MTPDVFLIEDNQVLKAIMVSFLERMEGVSLCGSAENAEEALEQLESLHPDLVLVDGSLPGMSGREFVCELKQRCPEIRCLFYSGRNEAEIVQGVLDAGACGYVVKGGNSKDLLEAISLSVDGKCYISPSVAGWEELVAHV